MKNYPFFLNIYSTMIYIPVCRPLLAWHTFAAT